MIKNKRGCILEAGKRYSHRLRDPHYPYWLRGVFGDWSLVEDSKQVSWVWTDDLVPHTPKSEIKRYLKDLSHGESKSA